MNLDYLSDIAPREMVESMRGRGIKEFTPPQAEAIEKGLLQQENIIVASPTASGKTLIGEMASVYNILAKGKKAIYIGPMKALVSEKFTEFKHDYPYIKSAVSMGDLDSADLWLSEYEMIFISTEKFDSLLRHKIDWLSSVGCVVFDEIHMIDDYSRGPVLEVILSKLLMYKGIQIIGLSATIRNPEELSKWLNAKLVVSDYRPIKLLKGVILSDKIYYYDGYNQDVYLMDGSSKIPEARVLEDTLEKKKQMLIFYYSKRNAEAGALKLSKITENSLTDDEKDKLNLIADKVEKVLEIPTEQCKKIASLMRKGIAFHHSGLLGMQKTYIEDAFKENLIKAICATTTLGLGVNLPAHTVLIRDLNKHTDRGNEYVGVNEAIQLFGRAGRPKYDTEGRALIIAKEKYNLRPLYERYIESEPDPIESKLGVMPVLRMHILSFIAEDFLNSKDQIEGFLKSTFYGYQYGNSSKITLFVNQVIDSLMDWGFIEKLGNNFIATKIGKRISELYIDPLSAKWLNDSISKAKDTMDMLYIISNTLEMRPYVRVTEDAEAQFVYYKSINPDLYISDDEYSYYNDAAFSTAMLLNDWINEIDEDTIIKKYHTTPGAIYAKNMNADWLIYSAIEIAKIMKKPTHLLIETRVRLRYGIKDELLDLVRLEQIGRVRARKLFNNGIKSISDIRSNPEKVSVILGKEITKHLLDQLN